MQLTTEDLVVLGFLPPDWIEEREMLKRCLAGDIPEHDKQLMQQTNLLFHGPKGQKGQSQ